MSSVTAIVLAAGASLRLGTPKQLVQLGSETLLERAVRVASEAGLHPVYGVLPANLRIVRPPIGMIRVINQEAAEGMASSIRAGLQALQGDGRSVTGVVLLACDQPAVTAEHLRRLVNGTTEAIASAYAGRKGIPAYFPSSTFAALMALRGDSGARDLLKDANAVDLPGGEHDVDTIQDLELARKLYK